MLFPECEQPAVTTPVNVFKTPTSRRHTLSTPSPSSPLSSRRTAGFALSFGSNPGCMLPSPPRSPPSLLAPKRLFKPIPSGRTNGEEGRKTRRCQFLKKVQTGREDKAWKARGGEDEIMRMIFVAEHKRWEASLERAASRIPTIYEEEEAFDEKYDHEYPEELPENSPGFSPPEYTEMPSSPEDFDDYLDRDGKELEEMLSHMDLDMDREMAEC